MKENKIKQYRNGGDGFIQWCEENVCMPIYPAGSPIAQWYSMGSLPDTPSPETGRSYKGMWEAQKPILRQALRMNRGKFVHRLIIFCWMRGEGKTALGPVLINLWRFFNWPRQKIALASNSKDQTSLITFDLAKDIIWNSPALLRQIGEKNIKPKEIRMRDHRGNVASVMQSVAIMSSAILSGITGYGLSEVFQMRDSTRFTQIDGSIRNVPNALGVIDSTVAPRGHFLYNLYKAYHEGKDKTLFFSYRCSPNADWRDFWHPEASQSQINGYKIKFPRWEFDMYFRNTWGSGTSRVFTDDEVEATRYLGADGIVGNQARLLEIIANIREAATTGNMTEPDGHQIELYSPELKIYSLRKRLKPVSGIYTLSDQLGKPRSADLDDLDRLSELYDTDWAILCGIDRADPFSTGNNSARTIMVFLAKGMVGSRSIAPAVIGPTANYIYVLLNLVHVEDSSLEWIKNELIDMEERMGGLDAVTGERYGLFDLYPWCQEMSIPFALLYPDFQRQAEAFGELQRIVMDGRLKYPNCAVRGSRHEDLFEEEMLTFQREENAGKEGGFGISRKKVGSFGSPEKALTNGIQDDSVYAMVWAIYGAVEISTDHFRKRTGKVNMGITVEQKGLMGNYDN